MNDKERNEILLKSIDGMIEQAPEIGICPLVFKFLCAIEKENNDEE